MSYIHHGFTTGLPNVKKEKEKCNILHTQTAHSQRNRELQICTTDNDSHDNEFISDFLYAICCIILQLNKQSMKPLLLLLQKLCSNV